MRPRSARPKTPLSMRLRAKPRASSIADEVAMPVTARGSAMMTRYEAMSAHQSLEAGMPQLASRRCAAVGDLGPQVRRERLLFRGDRRARRMRRAPDALPGSARFRFAGGGTSDRGWARPCGSDHQLASAIAAARAGRAGNRGPPIRSSNRLKRRSLRRSRKPRSSVETPTMQMHHPVLEIAFWTTQTGAPYGPNGGRSAFHVVRRRVASR